MKRVCLPLIWSVTVQSLYFDSLQHILRMDQDALEENPNELDAT